MKIILSRHGKPALTNPPKLSALDFGTWIETYRSSGIGGSKPPDEVLQAASSCAVLVCSTLQRSIESAELLCRSKLLIKKSVFKEMDLPFADWKYPSLSPSIWIVIFRLLWFIGFSKHSASFRAERTRAKTAAADLITLAREYDSVMLAGHGMLNRFIAGELLAKGWVGPKSPGSHFWQYGEFTKDRDEAVS